MKRLLITVGLALAPAFALGSGHADVHLSLPERPEMAVVQPGVQVVVGQDDEVFYMNHHYWLRREGAWYHARHHSDPFVYSEHHVPAVLVSLPLGQYSHYHSHAAYGGDEGYYESNGHHGGGCGGGGHGH